MPHEVEGLDLRFTSRTSWKAEVSAPGFEPLIAPVTWTSVFRREGSITKLEVWFQNSADLQAHLASVDPFVIALAEPNNWAEGEPTSFKRFNGVFLVRSLGEIATSKSIECQVLRRLNLSNWIAPRK